MPSRPGAVPGSDPLGGDLAPRQRIGVAVVQLPDPVAVEAPLLHLEIGSRQRVGGKLLDRETHGFGGTRKPPVTERSPLRLAAACREQLGLEAEVESGRLARGLVVRNGTLRAGVGFGGTPLRNDTGHTGFLECSWL